MASKRRRGRGEGSVYQRSRTLADGSVAKYWTGALVLPGLYSPNGRPKKKMFQGRTRADVVAKLQDAQSRLADGMVILTNSPTVESFLTRWLADVAPNTLEPRTFETYAMYARNHIIPKLGRHKLTDLTAPIVQAFLNERRAAGLSAQTVRHLRGILRSALKTAQRWDLVSRNVAQLTEPPKLQRQRKRRLRLEEARRLLAACSQHRMGALFATALALGRPRQSQLLALAWDDLDATDWTAIPLDRSLHRVGGEYSLVDRAKTESSIRSLPLADQLAEILRDHRTRQLLERSEAEETAKRAGRDPAQAWTDSGLVFTTKHGEPLSRHTVSHEFKKVLTAVGIPDLTFHDLRGSCVSIQAALGIPLHVAQDILAHEDPSTTAKYYLEVFPEEQRAAVELLAGALWPTENQVHG